MDTELAAALEMVCTFLCAYVLISKKEQHADYLIFAD